ncbi:MAG: hypothetical protein DRJ38_08180 [Thermoprotei archaeon]|nr:MAG: hypothetical protein DRJ38_08180 [Thermoprotei archaeon]
MLSRIKRIVLRLVFRKRKHVHKWVQVSREPAITCSLCGKVLAYRVVYECDICGAKDCMIDVLENYSFVNDTVTQVNPHYQKVKLITLCRECYPKFVKKVEEIKKELKKYSTGFKVYVTKNVAQVTFRDIKSLIEWIQQFIIYISEPCEGYIEDSKEKVFGLEFYAVAKYPSGIIYKILVPYREILNELKHGSNVGEEVVV